MRQAGRGSETRGMDEVVLVTKATGDEHRPTEGKAERDAEDECGHDGDVEGRPLIELDPDGTG